MFSLILLYIKNQRLHNMRLLLLPEVKDSNRPEKCNLLALQTLPAPTNAHSIYYVFYY